MAKRRRRSRVLEPTLNRTVKKADPPIDGLSAPNHCVPTAKSGTGIGKRTVYPLLRLAGAAPGCGTSDGLLFVDARYGCRNWPDRQIGEGDCPPSWMDPEMFAEMCLDADSVKSELAKVIARKTQFSQALDGAVQELFEQQYLAYMFEQFEPARETFVRWLVAHAAADNAKRK